MAYQPGMILPPPYEHRIPLYEAAPNQEAFGWPGFNRAAWLIESGQALQVGFAEFTAPSAHQIVVRNGAVGVNPVEWTKQFKERTMFPWIKCPFVLGNDCAGEVVRVGSMVTQFKVGDRVLAHALSMDEAVNKSSEGAFQNYTVIRENMAAVIPQSLSYEEACVIPLSLSTAATALFGQDFLSLHHPGIPRSTGPDSRPEVVLIWGGSTPSGSNAIQLAVAAGYQVITTCGLHNFKYVAGLGASAVFDYHNPLAIQQIVELMAYKRVVGAIAIGNDSAEACIEALGRMEGCSKIVARVDIPCPFPGQKPTGAFRSLLAMGASIQANFKAWMKAKNYGVKTKLVCGTSAAHTEVGAMVYNQFLPGALATGAFVAAPKPRVVGKGLEQIQTALSCHMRGASAQKIVVSL